MKNTIITSLLLLSLVLTTIPAAEAQSQSKQSAAAARRAQIEARREARRHRENADDEYTRFRENARQEYSNFRQKANQEYADFLRKAWEEFRTVKGEPIPDKDVKPLPIIEYEKKYDEKKEAPIEDRRLPIKEQIVIPAPEPKPQPKPVEPIKEVPVPAPTYFDFTLYSTPLRVRDFENFRLTDASENSVADAWNVLSGSSYNNLIADCLKIRDERNLCDWAYFDMVRALSEKRFGAGSDRAAMLTGFILSQSGYKMRYARVDGHLDVLFGTPNVLFNRRYFSNGGLRFYSFFRPDFEQCFTYNREFPGERALSLDVKLPRLDSKASAPRTMAASSYKYPDVKTDVSVDAALMDFYTSYPTSATAENFMTRWAYYARTPLCDRAKSTLYPMLRARTQNLDKLAATELILNWAQQSLPYGYDDEIWGGDRAFFPDETLFYPKCDCEDHAILFVRLIRDILGLKTALIYYPGHLASAVNFPKGSMAKGDYVDIDGERFYICDPTSHNPVGVSMRGFPPENATAIIVE